MKYKNEDGIELNFGSMSETAKIGSGVDLIQEVVGEVIDMLKDVSSPGSTPMRAHHRVEVRNIINFLKENFDMEENSEVFNS